MSDDTGRCVNCGFLGKRRKVADAESIVYTATDYDREQGTFNRESGWPDKRDMPTYITCFRNATNLRTELARELAKNEKSEDISFWEKDYTCTIIEKSRKCTFWYPWTEYLNPKEHFEEFKMQQLEQERKEFELKLFNMNKKLTTDSNRVMIGLAIGAVIFAAAEVFFAVAVINPNHWLFGWIR